MFRFTIRDLLWLTVVVAVALGVYFLKPQQPRWEYKTIYSASDGELNAEADRGWELITVVQIGDGQTADVFKRRK
jgi:hypothetical protein